MEHVRQSVEIHWGFGTPKLKGRLVKPVIHLPVKKAVKDPINADTPVYIKPLELEPVIIKTIEPPIGPIIQDIIPPYIGGIDESEQKIHKGDAQSAPTTEDENLTE